jgi:hypothetical protein
MQIPRKREAVSVVCRDRSADTRTFRFHLRNALYQSEAERHPAVGSQVAWMEPQVGEGGQGDAEGGQPGPGVDRLRPAGVVDPSVGRVTGGQGVGVVPVAAVDHQDDQGGGHQRSSDSRVTAG